MEEGSERKSEGKVVAKEMGERKMGNNGRGR